MNAVLFEEHDVSEIYSEYLWNILTCGHFSSQNHGLEKTMAHMLHECMEIDLYLYI